MTMTSLQAKVGLTRNMRELAAIVRQEKLLAIGTHPFFYEEASTQLMRQTEGRDGPYLVEKDGERALVFSSFAKRKRGFGEFAGRKYPLGAIKNNESIYANIVYEVKTSLGEIRFWCLAGSWDEGRISKARDLREYLELRARETEFILEFQKLGGGVMFLLSVHHNEASVIFERAGLGIPPQNVFLSVAGEIVKAYVEIGNALKESAGILSFGGYEKVCLKRTRDQIRDEMKLGNLFRNVPILENRSLIF